MTMRGGVHKAVAGVCTVVIAVYAWPLLDPRREWQFVHVWDDHENFVDNDEYRGLSPSHLRRMFSLMIINVWEPFGWLLKAIVFAIAGLDSRAYRIATLIFHVGAAWFLAKTAALLLAIVHAVDQRASKDVGATRSPDQVAEALDPRYHLNGSVLAALALFVVHPINVEVVAWPSAQPYALAAFLSALALFFHSRRLHRVIVSDLRTRSPCAARGASPESESLPSDWDRLIALVAPPISDRDTQLAAACFVAAVLSKSVCILLPAVTVLIDTLVVLPTGLNIRMRTSYFPPGPQCVRYGIKYLVSKSLLICTAVMFICVTVVANKEGANANADIITLTLSQRIIKALSAPAWTMRGILWPTMLRPHYRLEEDEVTLANPEYLVSVASLPLCISWFASRESTFRVPVLLCAVYFCMMLLPTSGLIQHGIVSKGADRYGYFPIMVMVPIGGYWLTCALALHASENQDTQRTVIDAKSAASTNGAHKNGAERTPSSLSRRHSLAWMLYIAGVAIMVAIDVQQMQVWQNSETHLEHSLRLDRADSRLMHTAYGFKVVHGGGCTDDPQACKDLLSLAYYYAPTKSEKAKLYRYMLLFLLDRRDIACEGFKLMKAEYPESAIVENDLAVCALLEGRLEDAREHITHAQKLTFYSAQSQGSINANYFHMVTWIDATILARGNQQPFEAKLAW